MDIRSDSLDFSLPLRGSGPRTLPKTIVFPRDVRAAVAGITGYLAEFSGGDDHHIGLLDVRLTTEIAGSAVTVTGTFGVRDWSGNWDDNYDGVINFVVVAELASITGPPPRGDLAITGVELNQATQFFRAGRFLDLANAHPDNSVFLIDGKNTGVRVYSDYDASSGLPTIAHLSGELIVSSASGSMTLVPINPGIVPKRDAAINQALPNDTLNFMIPAGFSTGTVTISCRVFDQSNPSQTSRSFTQTLVFTPVEPLNIFLVGVQTQQPAAPAPSQAAIVSAFSLLQKSYPRGLVQFTGFNTIMLAPQIAGSNASSGCGSGWETLLDLLGDLKGGSDDVYFGGLPPGISAAGVIGCSPVGDRIAASFIDLVATIPHEVGHSLGLRHDPCRGCSPPAQDPDNSYPQYNTFGSDSIGVFGFDPLTNSVLNPANATDFMTAFLPAIAWISPFTHQKLIGTIQGGPAPGGGMTLLRGEHEVLILTLEISRDRKVKRRVAFHHPATFHGGARCESPFTFELLDKEKNMLDCGPLHCLCTAGHCKCWPKKTRDVISYPPGATLLLVYEVDRVIYEEKIPDPPKVRITDQRRREEGIELKWEARGAEAFLVHYRSPRGDAWRGVAPRSNTSSIVIPFRLFGQSKTLMVRVLASSGIATGYAETEVKLESSQPPEVTLTLSGGEPSGSGPVPIDATPQLLATDSSGAQIPDTYVSWHTGEGETIGQGRQIDLRTLAEGKHTIRAVIRRHGGRSIGKSWIVERRGHEAFVHEARPDPPRTPRGKQHEHPHPPPRHEKE